LPFAGGGFPGCSGEQYIEEMMMVERVQPVLGIEQFHRTAQAVLGELRKVMVGQEGLIHDVLVTLLGGGNALMEGVPGLGKTILVRTLGGALDCSFSRIQFTPDLMPADVVGTNIIVESEGGGREFRLEQPFGIGKVGLRRWLIGKRNHELPTGGRIRRREFR
jgi:hypothetical protein